MGVQIQPPGPAVSPVPVASLFNYGSVTDPGALATIASISSPGAGTYSVTAYPEVSGTTAAADEDNMQLVVDGTVKSTIPVPSNVTTGGQGQPVTAVVQTTGTSIAVRSVAAGTSTAVYSCLIVATKVT